MKAFFWDIDSTQGVLVIPLILNGIILDLHGQVQKRKNKQNVQSKASLTDAMMETFFYVVKWNLTYRSIEMWQMLKLSEV